MYRKNILWSALALIGALCWLGATPLVAQAQLEPWQILRIDRAAFRQRTVAVMPAVDDSAIQMVYGDRYGVLRVVALADGSAREVWRSRTLEGAIIEVMVEDLGGDGRPEIICRTQNSRIYVYDDQFNLRWESTSAEYPSIEAMAIGNVDEDQAYEIILLASGVMNYVDGEQFQREFRSTESFRSTEIAVGNVDSDVLPEIVLNEGLVLDAQRAEIEWQTEIFGQFIELLDIDGDGRDEILGWTPNAPMRIFDADDRQEKPIR